ncbi:MAG: cellobiose phosphorylase [Candidatus Omnitrophota bacterium]
MEKLWEFTDGLGSFTAPAADKIKSLYFPLCNESLMSSLTPELRGDIKGSQNSFLLEPASRASLVNSRSSRNFWVYINQDKIWSACGVSKNFRQVKNDHFDFEAGLLWQRVSRENKSIGLKSEATSFVPASGEPVEIMRVKLTNTSRRKIAFVPTAAIPLYARSADNIRDHRHVTSLLQRVILNKYGVISKPTLLFDETGHKPNKDYYFVLGVDAEARPPRHIYPTQEMFCGEAGDLEAPAAILNNLLPDKRPVQGKEPMGALRFGNIALKPGQSRVYIIVMGIAQSLNEITRLLNKFNTAPKVEKAFRQTKAFWIQKARAINISSAEPAFDNWLNWVNIQPFLRRTFGCSFLPDFDYGKGGRGWRDLWQDCLGLVLNDPGQARRLLLNNLSGVRIDGSNATIVGKKPGEFIADRNNIARVWMDHGVWPLITTDLYINETGDLDILFAEAPYFCDRHSWRSSKFSGSPDDKGGNKLRSVTGKIYTGSIFEHLLIQNLAQFFNVGPHNHIRLEGADWNDGLDMAGEYGESVTFSAVYARNLNLLAEVLLKTGKKKVELAEEILILLKSFDYKDKARKRKILESYFAKVQGAISGKKKPVGTEALARSLKIKSLWMARHIREKEWLKEGFFNGYYDNKKRRVEGRVNGRIRMCLASQVFPVMSGIPGQKQVNQVIKSVNRHLWDRRLKSYHLNTDFSPLSSKAPGGIRQGAAEEERYLGRAFSFSYGDKENGAIFAHMVVMYAYGLYNRGFAKEGWKALRSLYMLAGDSKNSRIYPCLPEYFDAEGRGMYSYLTGSASWFILTLLTQAFGARGEDGNLVIEPKLTAGQFASVSTVSLSRPFAGSRLQINISNPDKLDYGRYKILRAFLNSKQLTLEKGSKRILINRRLLQRASSNIVSVILG